MEKRRRDTASLQDVIPALLDRVSAETRDPLPRLRLSWQSICGGAAALHSEPLSFEDGGLIIGVRGKQWRDALFHDRVLLKNRVRAVTPQVRWIRLRSLATRPLPPSPPPPPPPPQDARTADIEDAALRRALDGLLHVAGGA
jgi:hypothetical protein